MTRVVSSHLIDGCPWPEGEEHLRIRPLDVARAAATTLSAGSALPLNRRILRTAGVVLEVVAHLRSDWSGHGLHAVGLEALDGTARAEVVQRIGVGLARVVAERGPLRLVDLYNLDALATDPSAPVSVKRVPRTRRRPDFVGSDVVARWSLIEAKGRTERGELDRVRRRALEQVRSVDLVDHRGDDVPLAARVSFVSRLNDGEITVFADDPPAGDWLRRYEIDPEVLVHQYYELPRALLRLVGRAGPGLSGAVHYAALPLIGGGPLILGVHRRVIDALDNPSRMIEVRRELRETYLLDQREAEEAQDPAISIGPDGLALASRDLSMQTLLEP